jgi:hypothetical protein
MDVLACIDWCNSCIWNTIDAILLICIGCISGCIGGCLGGIICTPIQWSSGLIGLAIGWGIEILCPALWLLPTEIFYVIFQILVTMVTFAISVPLGTLIGALCGPFGGSIAACATWCSGILLAWIPGCIAGISGGPLAPLLSPIGALLAELVAFMCGWLPGLTWFFQEVGGMITGVCCSIPKSLTYNLIGIIGSPIIIRATFLDGCLKEFLTACLDLIRHLM